MRGGAPGTRETAALDAVNMVEHIHAIVLSGGSVFGLDAASAVTFALAKRGIGFTFGAQAWPCPLVPAAVLFDIMNGGDKMAGRAALSRARARGAGGGRPPISRSAMPAPGLAPWRASSRAGSAAPRSSGTAIRWARWSRSIRSAHA